MLWFLSVIHVISSFLIFKVSSQEINIIDVVKELQYEKVLKSISPDQVGTTQCQQHLSLLIKNVMNEDWAMRMFDASTKIPDSLFMGLLTHLGNFDECIEVQNVQTDYGPFDGQHCLVTVNLSDINLGSLSESTNLKVFTERNQLQMKMAAVTTIQNLQLSYCIPSTCSIKDFEIFLNKYIQNSNIGISGILHIPNGMCQTANGRSLVTEDWIALAILVIVILLSVSSTAYDVIKKDSKKELLTAFSWYSNGKKLFSTKTSGDTIQAIQGMRLVSMCWVIMGHRYFLAMQVPAINMMYVVDYVQDASKLTVTNATLAVDSFLFFSGLLVSYIFLMHVKKQQKPFNIGLYYIHRYLRLTPPYAVMIMLQATLLRYVSSGPLFNSTVDLYANNCKENWWTNILYINNYVGVENQCIPQSWYLAIDMHLFILSPIILIPLWKLPRKWSLTILGVLICSGLITAFAVSFVEEFPASLFSANPDLVRLQYYPTHARFTPWLIGVGYGYFFYETKRRNLKLSKLTVFLGWCMSNVAMLGTVHGVYAFYQDFSLQSINEHTTKDDTANIESSMYTTFARSSWALGVGWVAYACAFDYAGPINNLLSWKVFRPLSRLTYCAYLVHASYQVIQTYSTRTPSYISDLNILPSVVSDIILCLLLAAVLSLTVEVPVIILEKHAFGGGKSRNKEENLETGTVPESTQRQDRLNSVLQQVRNENAVETLTSEHQNGNTVQQGC